MGQSADKTLDCGKYDKDIQRFLSCYVSSQKRLWGFILALSGNWEDANDIMQETTALMWSRFSTFREGSNFTAWAIKIARIKILEYRRRNSSRPVRLGVELLEDIEHRLNEQTGELDSRLEAVQLCRRKLSEADQKILELRYEQNLKPSDIARKLGRSAKSVYKSMGCIHNQLRECVRRRLDCIQHQEEIGEALSLIDMSAANCVDFAGNVLELFDGCLPKSQLEEFFENLQQDSHMVSLYVELSTICVGLSQYSEAGIDTILLAEKLLKSQSGIQDSKIRELTSLESAIELDYAFMEKKAEAERQRQAELTLQEARNRRARLAEVKARYRDSRRISRGPILLAIASAAAILLMFAGFWIEGGSKGPQIPSIVAKVADSHLAGWDESHKNLKVGHPVRAGHLKLVSGLVSLKFTNNVEMIMQGPCDLDLESDNCVNLRSGQVFVKISGQCSDFTVLTPTAAVVDHGTEFGVSVSQSGQTEAHVFKGLVSLHEGSVSDHQSHRDLLAGQAGVVDSQGRLARGVFKSDSRMFVKRVPTPYEKKLLSLSPAAYWGFDAYDKDFVFNEVDPDILWGIYRGQQEFCEGPCLGGNCLGDALKLGSSGNYAVVPFDDYEEPKFGYSYALWIQPHGSGRQNVFCGKVDGVYGSSFSRQLRINDEGQLEYYVFSGYFEAWPHPDVPLGHNIVKCPEPVVVGKWYHVAVVVGEDKLMHLFVDGKEVGSNKILGLPEPGYCEMFIGSPVWAQTQSNTCKAFDGCVDVMAFFDRELTKKEISELYKSKN